MVRPCCPAVLVLLCLSGTILADDAQAVSEKERLRFEQEKVAANMRELEDRMLKLGELLRDSKPDDSARLLLGVEEAREALILEQMQAVTELLASVDLSRATDEQEQILKKLQRLKQSLLNDDLDLKIKLEQLKKLEAARRKLAELITKEEQQKAATEAAGKQSKDTNPLAAAEQRNQRSSENLSQQIKQIAWSGAASQAVSSASKNMQDAAKTLAQGECQSACNSQQRAINDLKKAEEELVALKQKLQEQAEAAARHRVTELLNEMVERQTVVRDHSISVAPELRTRNAQARSLVKRLAEEEAGIVAAADECIEICDLTEFSFVLPSALCDIRGRMDDVRSTLQQIEVNDVVIDGENRIIEDLNELLDAMKQAGKPGSPKISNSKCGQCNTRNKFIAELKMLLFMQRAVQNETQEVREKELSGQLKGPELHAAAQQVRQKQEKINEVTNRLRELAAPDFVNGDSL